LSDVRVWNQKNRAVLVELDTLTDDPEQLSAEAALPFDWRLCSQLDLATGKSFEVLELHQRPLEPRRAHFEAVAPGRKQVIVNVQGSGYVPADPGAILQRDATAHLHAWNVPVDDDPNDSPSWLPHIADVDQLHAMSAANWVDQPLQRVDEVFSSLGQFLLGVPERKTGGPWRPTQKR
jgi:hypothetical protein